MTLTAATPVVSLAARVLGLSPALTRDVRSRRDIAVRSRDGVILRTDHYAPRLDNSPTVLIRTPYGRGGVTAIAARLLAERGFDVVLQSCRGTGGSGGAFDPMRHERDDGLDTVDWLRRQPWFNGKLGMFGPSYVGYTQWAISDVPELAAMATIITASSFQDPVYAGNSFALFTTLAWATVLQSQTEPWLVGTIEAFRGQPRLRRAFAHLPLTEADERATGAEVSFFRRWLDLAGGDPSAREAYWGELSHAHRLPEVTAPVLMMGGWYDIFLPWQLHDYETLRAAGANPYLTIGPWTHGGGGLLAESVRESVDWLRAHLRGEPDLLRERPVRVYVVGAESSPAGAWREFESWPPPFAAQRWHLHPGGRLAPTPTPESTVDRFRFDPADPTPTVGGPLLLANFAGPRDNRAVEARSDVLVYTSDALSQDLEIIGPVTATVCVRGSQPYHDVFVRLCDVEPSGRSINVCDGLARLSGDEPRAGDGRTDVSVKLWPAAHRFRAGNRVRVQVSGGAHPRYARNPGTGEPLATATDLLPVDVEVLHGSSLVELPVA